MFLENNIIELDLVNSEACGQFYELLELFYI